jgi:xanthine dehydrogenase molybdopterin-binding subunit B
MATASHMSYHSPPPFAAQFAEVEVDTETGQVTVLKLVMAVDCGTAINPQASEGQIEGGMAQALGYTVSEAMVYDEAGRLLTRRLGDYRLFSAGEMRVLQAILVPTAEPSGPVGAKAVAEIPMDGGAPAVGNAEERPTYAMKVAEYAPNTPIDRVADVVPYNHLPFGSFHPGGVNFGLADASVRFIVDDVDVDAYKAACTINESETLGVTL